MARDHVDGLFSAAYDDELSSQQAVPFQQHLAACAQCAERYAEYRAALRRVHALPHARMPLPVHLPSEKPTAERQTATGWLRGLRHRRFFPGPASAVAAVAAAVIALVVVTRPNTNVTHVNQLSGSSAANNAATPAACPAPAQQQTAATDAYTYRTTKTDPSRPGQQFVLAASSASAAPGEHVVIYAGLTIPLSSAGRPGTAATSESTTVAPCIAVSGLANGAGASSALAPLANEPSPASVNAANGAAPAASPTPVSVAGRSVPALNSLTIPTGTPAGTVIHVVASIPANYPMPGDPPLSLDLTITVR
ncbi:MAG: anti-sigma factor [Candidatus Dormibacteria bacterium]